MKKFWIISINSLARLVSWGDVVDVYYLARQQDLAREANGMLLAVIPETIPDAKEYADAYWKIFQIAAGIEIQTYGGEFFSVQEQYLDDCRGAALLGLRDRLLDDGHVVEAARVDELLEKVYSINAYTLWSLRWHHDVTCDGNTQRFRMNPIGSRCCPSEFGVHANVNVSLNGAN